VRPTDWSDSKVPEGKWGAKIGLIPKDLPYVEKVVGYVEALRENVERGRGLLLWGPYRGGKSCIAAAVCGRAMTFGLEAHWVFAFDVADIWIARRGTRKADVRGAHLLVIDDLGMESQDHARGDFPREKIRDLLRVRLEGARPTIVTTNLSPDQVRKTYGEKAWALMTESLDDVLVTGAEDFWKERRWEAET
jgi:DNA replication protein DnaC